MTVFESSDEAQKLQDRIDQALIMAESGSFDGAHHKMWVIDQMVRILCGSAEAYEEWLAAFRGECTDYGDGYVEYEYEWDEGIAP